MAIKYGFFNSLSGDRRYSARDIEKVYNLIVSDGIIASANGELSEALKVKYYSGLELRVCAGNGIFGGHWMEMTSDELITIPTPHTQNPRIDSIVVRVDEDARNITLQYIQGTPSASPQAPTIQRSESVKEYRLANISVAANATSVSQSNITDTRPSADCGVVTNLLQNSDISATYSQWESQFNDFLTSKDTEFSERLDAISGLDANSILALQEDVVDIKGDISTLENTVDNNVAKTNSMSAKVETAISKADAIGTDLVNVTNDINALKKEPSVLWSGANLLGSGSSIKPSKKLNECKNGWILCWTGYNSGSASGTRNQFTYVPKTLLASMSSTSIPVYANLIYTFYESGNFDNIVKLVNISNDTLTGFVGNTATELGKGICLFKVIEF